MLWLVVAVPSLGPGSRWGRKRVEKEDPHLPGRIWEDLPKPRFLPAGH